MRLLKNTEQWNLYFDLDTNKVVSDSSYPPIVGWITDLSGNISTLYVEDRKLFFTYEEHLFEIDDSFYIILNDIESVNKHLIKKELLLMNNNNLLFKFFYFAEINYNLPPFDYIDDEDSDWGLFVANILNDTKRKEKFIQSKSK